MDKSIMIEGIKGKYGMYELEDTIEGQKILERVKRERLDMRCTCQGEGVQELKFFVAKNPHGVDKYSYIVRRGPNTMDKHHKDCSYFGVLPERDMTEESIKERVENQYKDSSKENKLIKEEIKNNERVLSFTTDAHIYRKLAVNKNKSINEYDKKGYSLTKSTMYALGENLLYEGWNEHISIRGNRMPVIANVFYNIYYSDKVNATIGNESTISYKDIMFMPYSKDKDRDISEWAKKAFFKIFKSSDEVYLMYVLGKIESTDNSDEEYIRIKVVEPFNHNYFYLYVDKGYYSNKKKSTPSKADKYISCMVEYKDNKLVVSTGDIIPVFKNRGFTVDSNYEVEFAEMLLEKGRPFVRTPRSKNPYSLEFNGNNPDFLLLDRKTRKVNTIVEVYGFNKDYEEYWKRASAKEKFYRSLRRKYDFIFWNAYNNSKMPYIE